MKTFLMICMISAMTAVATAQATLSIKGTDAGSGQSVSFTGLETADGGDLTLSGVVSVNGGKGVAVEADAIKCKGYHGYALSWSTLDNEGQPVYHSILVYIGHPTGGTWGDYVGPRDANGIPIGVSMK